MMDAPKRLRTDSSGNARLVNDAGYALAMTGLLIIPLLVATAFATDYGAWLAQAAKLQRTADNAAMAGVVYLPDGTKAQNAANGAITANGYTLSGTASTRVNVTFPAQAVAQQYRVELTQAAPQYFSRLFLSPITIKRGATAEFNKPVPLGSPANKQGNDVSTCPQYQPTASCGSQPMLWSAIQGPYEAHGNGDPYTTLCDTGQSGSGAPPSGCGTPANPGNPLYLKDGYTYAIDVPAAAVGQTQTIEIWDAAEIGRTSNRTATSGNDCNGGLAPWNPMPSSFGATNCQTGDSGPTDRNGIPMQFLLYQNDGNDLTVSFDAVQNNTSGNPCELYIPRDSAANPTAVSTYKNKWVTVCQFTPTQAGIFPMRVKSSNITLANGTTVADNSAAAGWNAFSLKVTGASGTNAKLYNLTNMSIWTNTPGSTARFYLAEIKPEHAGKKVVLDAFDPGDGQSGTYTMQLLAPPANAPAVPPTGGVTIPDGGTNVATGGCKANTTGSTNRGGGTLVVNPTCTVTTRDGSGQKFQNGWLRVEVQLSPTYTCSTDCWWTIKYDFGGASGYPNDRTVWTLNVLGDPVHLVQ